ncbi:unnamed protein product [Caenorhabditis nigoni]
MGTKSIEWADISLFLFLVRSVAVGITVTSTVIMFLRMSKMKKRLKSSEKTLCIACVIHSICFLIPSFFEALAFFNEDYGNSWINFLIQPFAWDVLNVGCRIPDCWVWIPDFGIRIPGSGFPGPDSGFLDTDPRVRIPGSGYRILGSGFPGPDSESRIPDPEFRIRVSKSRIPDPGQKKHQPTLSELVNPSVLDVSFSTC